MVSNSRKIALSGVMGALCILCLYLASYLPTSRLFFYGVSSLFCACLVIEAGTGYAWTFYGATSLLAFAVIPDKIKVIPYIAFFGMYGIIKCYIERLKNIAAEILLKGLYFAASACILFFLFKNLFLIDIKYKLPVWVICIAALVVFYIYDYAYTAFVMFYQKKIKSRIK